MPNVDGPIWKPYQTTVAGSAAASGSPERRNAARSCSLPGLASRRTSNPTLTINRSSACGPSPRLDQEAVEDVDHVERLRESGVGLGRLHTARDMEPADAVRHLRQRFLGRGQLGEQAGARHAAGRQRSATPYTELS